MASLLSLKHPEYLHIHSGDTLYYGADQEWFPLSWQRRAGCGPTTATHLVLYNLGKHKGEPAAAAQDQAVALMQQLWTHVTPTLMGVHLVSQFTKGLSSALTEQHINGEVVGFSLPKAKEARPPFPEVLNFIKESLSLDQPVAFLNLHHGDVMNLDSWHWVTIVALDADSGLIHVYDGGKKWAIDLALWYKTTPRAGGFASIRG
ncbi:MAG: hypothetical protein PWP25_689 [Sphaerochaeta sp.]|jgi:hypothetical protein|nr:hypothetical protein [Sphaerochaeta sp.]MDN5333518.1 hypothetical protein [Sphaerochaeta sp.]